MHDDFKPLSDLHRRDLGGDAIAHWQAQFAALAAIAPERRLEARRELLPRHLAAAYEAEDSFEGLDSDLVHPQWTLDHPDAAVRAAFDTTETHRQEERRLGEECGGKGKTRGARATKKKKK